LLVFFQSLMVRELASPKKLVLPRNLILVELGAVQ